MKSITCAAILVLFVISIAIPLTSAYASGPSASGSYNFVMEDEATKTLEFDARNDGAAVTGHMTFRDSTRIVEPDVDGTGERPEEPSSDFFITADLDSLSIEHNRALMGGIVRDSSNRNYIGRWVQLVVEDNGDGREGPDKLSWCFCQPEPGGWTPQDAEDPRDEGAFWHWWATDAERRDDVGIQSANIIPGTRRSCPMFALAAYEFPEVRGEGQIQITQ